jgi:hypothetical protein
VRSTTFERRPYDSTLTRARRDQQRVGGVGVKEFKSRLAARPYKRRM